MRYLLLGLIVAFFITSCGSGKVAYAWKGEAKAYMTKYQDMMLKGDRFQASYYLKDAIKEAQNDISLRSLATVYLGKCAIEKAVGIQTVCQSYTDLKPLFNDTKFEAYKAMLLDEEVTDTTLLGKYQSFYESLKAKNVGVSEIQSLDTIYAQSIAAMLALEKGQINMDIIDYMIDKASSENFKGLMLTWLKIAQKMATGEKKNRLDQKIKFLEIKP